MSGAVRPEAARLTDYVTIWWQAIDDFASLVESLPREQWSSPTDLPGWDVHAIVAHTAHLEHLLAGGHHEDIDVGEPEHVKSPMGMFTEQGVVTRHDATPDELINEIRNSATARHTELLADPPSDPDAHAPGVFGAIGWTMLTLLRNRPLDLWMHEQDIRRAVGQPGGMDSPAAVHTVTYLLESLPVVAAKRAKFSPGTTVAVAVEGHDPVAVTVDDDGRGVPASADNADVTLPPDREGFVLLAGGRRAASDRVRVDGDADLGHRLMEAMVVTP